MTAFDKCLLSVIIPVYNCEKYLGVAISSAIAQPGVTAEIIVIDDGSSDGSLEVAELFGNRVRVISQTNKGACVARNVGIGAARGQFVKFLDADDYLLPGALQAQHSHAETLGPGLFSYGRTMRHLQADGRLVPHSPRDMRRDNGDSLDNMLPDPPVTSAMLYSAEMLDELGGFDERLTKREDYDLFARALMAGYRPVPCQAPIYAYRSHESPNRISRRFTRESYCNQKKMFERQVELLRRAEPKTDSNDLRRGLANTIWVTARNCTRHGFEPEARRLFQLSESLDMRRNRKGQLPYRVMVRLFGPIVAEAILQRAKALRH